MTKKRDKIVGVKAITYPEKRNFAGLDVPGFSHKKVKDFYKYPAFAYFKLKGKPHPQWLNLFKDFNTGGYDILHFFNAVSEGKKPWVTTFEYYLPRGAHLPGEVASEYKYINKVLKLMASDNCKKLIALSDWARNAQIDYLKRANFSREKIENKLITIHPPQKKIVNDIDEKQFEGTLNLLLVGADFFRKGGLEALEVIDALISEGHEIKFSIVSRMQFGDYASQSTTEDVTKARAIIEKHPSIHLFDYLSNEEVIEKMKDVHLVLLPSYEETYGYTVLEGQAAACPVITTNGTAFEEINNNEIGWVIEVDRDEHGRTVPRSAAAKAAFQAKIKTALHQILTTALTDRELLKVKGKKALEKIEQQHNPVSVAQQLQTIYSEALNE